MSNATALTRRNATGILLGTAATLHAIPPPSSKIAGVQMGVQTYSYRTGNLDRMISGIASAGINSCELWSPSIEPEVVSPARMKETNRKPGDINARGVPIIGSREDLRKWRMDMPLSHFEAIRKRFKDAGIQIYAYNYSFRPDFTDAEIARGFEMAKALGAKVMTASATVSVAERVDRYARQYRMRVGMHNHSDPRADEFSKPEDFEAAMKGRSEYIAINLDIGHFTAANFDPVEYLKANAPRIVTLHIKDRKRNQGPNVPFGEGDTPIKAVLAVMKQRKLKIPANIEYEYEGGEPVEQVKRCLEYCRAALKAA